MKNLIYIIFICLSVFNCEEVVELNLKTSEQKLVIDASLGWIKNTNGKTQFIKLSLTAPYYDTSVPPATGAVVKVTDTKNNTFEFIEEENTGIYRNFNFIPEINGVYTLTILYNNEIYTGTETLMPVVPIEYVEQKNDAGFSGEDTEIKAYYTDPANTKNYYLFEYVNTNANELNIDVYDDEFTDGNRIFAFQSYEDLKSGDELIIKNHGISKQHFEYMSILLQQNDDNNSGDPFQTQPTTIRGNCINQTNPDNFPLGYFRVSEVSTFRYIVN
ncbi:DUF4249 domain-containing protein [Mariniflexile aquimaris]|uniref:DUF4249 domain-containing protein n=1 Tax=Mariniflexile aquimaris TaxID=881009 RepID=A0ABW3BRF1_9FLAO